jgi:hypothetical protein
VVNEIREKGAPIKEAEADLIDLWAVDMEIDDIIDTGNVDKDLPNKN